MKPFTTLAAILLALVALAHGVRLATHCAVVVGSHTMPMWISAVGLIVAAGLAIMLWREARS